jgi:hypothetical protein
LENYRLIPGAYSKILDRIKDELWAEFLYSYEILTLSIWSSNLTLKIWKNSRMVPGA